jgi:2-oxoglutarate dehydrogenase E1 component
VRIEQLYPFPTEQVEKILASYKNAKEVYWVQEEAENMGAWTFIMKQFRKMNVNIQYIGRKESASPATGYGKIHNEQSENIFTAVFGKAPADAAKKDNKKEQKV